MSDWIAWTRCPTCDYREKNVFERPDDGPPIDGAAQVRCPQCGHAAGRITFPVFEIETIEISPPGDPMYDTMDDW